MKKALTITLTLILGFGANFLAVLGLIALGLFVTDITPIWFAAAIAVIAAFTALLHFVRKKLTKFAHGTVTILCAQLPSILFWAVDLVQSVYRYKTTGGGFERIGAGIDAAEDAIAVIIPTVIMTAEFILWTFPANKDRLRNRWCELNQRNRLMRFLNKWWNEPL